MAIDMNLQKYFAFVKTVEYGSFTRAAQILNYSQSGISRMIADLENDWQVSLLERGKSGVRLTSDGVRLLPYAQNLCREFDKLVAQIDAISELETGLIRIGTISSIAAHWLPNIIKAFQRDYPNIDYELLLGDYGEIEGWIASGRVDCGFIKLPAKAELDTISLERDRLMAVIPASHPLASADVFPVSELTNAPFMLLEKGGQIEAAEIFAAYNIKPQVQFTTWDDYAIMSMVESGLGISILPELILKRTPYNIVAKPLDVPAYRQLGLALRNRKTASHAVKRFIEYLEYRNSGD